jgi:hypothetical protein
MVVVVNGIVNASRSGARGLSYASMSGDTNAALSSLRVESCARLNIGLVSTLQRPGTKIWAVHTDEDTMNESASAMENQ